MQKRGLAYERKAARALRSVMGPGQSLVAGPWIQFEDENGPGFARPDYLLLAPKDELVVVIECKLTFRRLGLEKLEHLYGPLVAEVHPDLGQRQVLMVRNLGNFAGTPEGIESVLLGPGSPPGGVPRFLVHWLGL